MSHLFSPLTLGQLQLRNRIVVSPMCQYSAADGAATDWHMMHLGQLALSGAGILFTEAAAVEAIGRISPEDLGLWSDQTEAALGRVVRAIRQYSAIPLGVQLAHAGRKASVQSPWNGNLQLSVANGGWQTVAPSALRYAPTDSMPLALDDAGLARVKAAFVRAAQRASKLGFEVIELHGAHGYLLHEFLSALSNQRSDSYGGTLENRLRFPLQVFDAVKAAIGDQITLGMRISATDWVEGGWDIEQSIVFVRQLQQRGCHFIDVSSGGLSPAQQISAQPGFQVGFAERIRQEVGIPTIAVGLITEPAQAEAIIQSGQADMVALARALLYDPHWPWHAAAELGAQVEVPPQYLRSAPHGQRALFKVPD